MRDIPFPPDFQSLSIADQDLFRMRKRWLDKARPEQLPPPGNWWIWLLLAGRGFGKTRTAAEDMAYHALANPDWKLGVIAPTFAAIRDVCFEGESGILSCFRMFGPLNDNSYIERWNRSMGELILRNGTIIKGFSAEEPERLRGPQFHRVWVDELASMPTQAEVWEQLELTARLPPDPRIIVTTTPKANSRVTRELIERSFPSVDKTEALPLDAANQNMVPTTAPRLPGGSMYTNSFVQM